MVCPLQGALWRIGRDWITVELNLDFLIISMNPDEYNIIVLTFLYGLVFLAGTPCELLTEICCLEGRCHLSLRV